MLYNNTDNHPTVNILKKKGWKVFEVYSSRHKNEYGGWWIDTAIAYDTEYRDSHKIINGKFLGMTLKEALYTLRKDDFPVNSDLVYPLAFLTKANKIFMKSKTEVSGDGTPRYIPNPNSSATYCLRDCMKDYTPIYDRKVLKQYI